MSKRKATNGNEPGHLTPQQCTAVDLLVSGKTLTETAEALGVGRPAVSDWCNHFPAFQAALNSRRQEAFDSMVERLRGLLPQALDVIEAQLQGDNPLPAALAVLKACSLDKGLGRPTGPATIEEVEQVEAKRAIDHALTAISAEDVQRAQRKREQDRMMQELLL